MVKQNIGRVYNDDNAINPIQTASTNFEIFELDDLEMIKTVDKPDEYYYIGDPITFTITIKNTGNKNFVDLIFKDTIDTSVVPETGTEYDVSASIGTIISKGTEVEIGDINLDPDDICTITIKGIIA